MRHSAHRHGERASDLRGGVRRLVAAGEGLLPRRRFTELISSVERRMADELGELKEHAEHGAEGGLAAVTLTMAILAVLVASVTLLGHRAHTEEVSKQSDAADKWAYYQAKDSRLMLMR